MPGGNDRLQYAGKLTFSTLIYFQTVNLEREFTQT
jgi:hypothetical protein